MTKKKNGIAPAVFTTHPIAETDDSEASTIERRPNGQFETGHTGVPGAGRPIGAKNKLTEDFLSDFHEAWQTHGKSALETMATEEPTQFVKAAVQLMPRDVLLEARGAGLVVVRLDETDMAL